MNIYGFPTFNLSKVLITAEELSLDYELHLLDASKGEHKSPEHLERHPLGKIPAIEYQGDYYIESNSICRLLAEENDNRLYGNSAKDHAKVNQWIDLFGFHLGRWMGVLYFEELIKSYIPNSQANPDNIAEANEFLQQQLPVFNNALEQQNFLVNDQLSIADIIAFAYCQTQHHTQLNFNDYSNIDRWYHNMSERHAVKKAMAKLPNHISPFN
ncbi:glutathione S-transferase family protein [Pleionea sp. CnH1-48]|uniref:glutathione S-transferase family protein n=1 Tax=Pleionea sp. CnH1-48 TaxID=2954494 RepID=UPI002097B8C4|nr:glutathione S-transferase family protein [Pleionea sp. CnH1-48]MCO7222848.1 glutathione S-transferase family protein [Pleionea sp. CnH1-48]